MVGSRSCCATNAARSFAMRRRSSDVNRKPDRAVEQSALQRLLDPPRRVCAETEPASVVELVGCAEKAEVALLNEVEERDASPEVLSREEDDEAEVTRH